MNTIRPLAVVIMAAGKGTRMNNPSMAKVMYPVGGKPMVELVTDLALRLQAARTVVVVGWQKDSVINHLGSVAPGAMCVEQSPQLGTGHAVMQAGPVLNGFEGDVLVLSGDVPLLREETVRALIEVHRSGAEVATVLTTILDDPTGYGRMIRDATGRITGIVEQKDATPEQRAIKEVNSGIYMFQKELLFEGLANISTNNAQKEYYLTDVFGYFWKKQLSLAAVVCSDPMEIRGVNTLEQLGEAQKLLALRRI